MLAIVGGLILIIFVILTIIFWSKFKSVPKVSRFRWSFDKKVYFSFGLVLTLFSLFFALVVAANISTALKPLPGFTSLASNTSTSSASKTGKALNNWVRSGDSTMPTVLKQKVEDRIQWQRPKAIICGMLLVVFVLVSVRLWRYVLKARTLTDTKWSIKEILAFIGGSLSVAISLLLVVMFAANTQGAIAPIAISLLGAGG